MTMHEMVDYSELAQGILIPVFAFILVAEAMLMRFMMREIFFLRMEVEAIKRVAGINVSVKARP
jgi:hypothetical protein